MSQANHKQGFARVIALAMTEPMEDPMRILPPMMALMMVGCLIGVGVHAQSTPAPATCKSQATDKKLAGAALTSFMKKCETDAATTCDTSAADKKLSGAAKTSFTKKCVTDAVGN
jgi:hypothetical protein